MISLDKARQIIAKAHPKDKVEQVFEYRKQFYVFELKDKEETTYDSPFYLVSKITGKLTSFIPTEDLDGFFSDMENHQLGV